MGILTRGEILKEIKNGNIEVEPFSQEQVGPASIDFRVGAFPLIPSPLVGR